MLVDVTPTAYTIVIRMAIFVFSAVAIVLWVHPISMHKYYGYFLPALFWLVNVLVFNLCRIFFPDAFSVYFLNGWSLGIQLHGVITLMGVGAIRSGKKLWMT